MVRWFTAPLLLCVVFVGACAKQAGRDVGLDRKDLANLKASIWTDPKGCDHWVVDDGGEGYMTVRRGRDGKPVCSGTGNSSTAGIGKVSMNATLWTDERGCQHWVVDDGGEGFMSERVTRNGRPVCKGAGVGRRVETITLAADALFDTDSARLRPAARSKLDAFGQKMKQAGKRRVFIVGHTDSQASDRYNQRLSERRASAVSRYLKGRYGIISRTAGRGESEPVADNSTREGRQANRRVVISVLD